MPAKVIVRDLKKHYDGVEAARGVSFDIEDGEIFGLIGPNGAGKTTTLECVIGLREPDSGRIEICGIDARQHPCDVKQKIGAALQTTSLQDKITPREALALFASFYRQRTAAAELLERFGLTDKADAPFDTLSGGQRQRLALALAFVNRARAGVPRRAHVGARRAIAPRSARRDPAHEGGRPHRAAHDPLHRRGRSALRPGRGDPQGHDRRDRRHARAHGTVLRLAVGDRHRHAAARSRARWRRSPASSDLVCDGHTRAVPHLGRQPRDRRSWSPSSNDTGIEITELHVQKATLEDVFLELTSADADARRRDDGRLPAPVPHQPAPALPQPDGADLQLSVSRPSS